MANLVAKLVVCGQLTAKLVTKLVAKLMAKVAAKLAAQPLPLQTWLRRESWQLCWHGRCGKSAKLFQILVWHY